MRSSLWFILSLLLLMPVAYALSGGGYNVTTDATSLQGGYASGSGYVAQSLTTDQPGYLLTCSDYTANIGVFPSSGGVCQTMKQCSNGYRPFCTGLAACDNNPCDGCSVTAASCTANLVCEAPSNLLIGRHLRENITTTLTGQNLSILKDYAVGGVQTQTLTFGPQRFGVNFVANNDNRASDYLVIDSQRPFMTYRTGFSQGLTGTVAGRTVPGLVGAKLRIMDRTYTVGSIVVNTTTNMTTLSLLNSATISTLVRGVPTSVVVNGTLYTVNVTDINTSNTPNATFTVSGEATQALTVGDSDALFGGVILFVTGISENSVSAVLGTNLLELSAKMNNGTTGSVEINYENSNDADVGFTGTLNTTTFILTNITYELTMDPADGSIAYIGAGEELRTKMSRPEFLLGSQWNIYYDGIATNGSDTLSIAPVAADQYNLIFTNKLGSRYNISFLSNNNSVFKFGNATGDLVFMEANSSSNPNININDTFVIGRKQANPENTVTNVLRYKSIDTAERTVEFTALDSGSVITSVYSIYQGFSGTGTLVVNGESFDFYIENVTNATVPHRIAIDLNGDHALNQATVPFTTKYGHIFSIASAYNGTTLLNGTNLTQVVGDGKRMYGATSVNVSMQTRAAIYGYGVGDTYSWTIAPNGENVSMSVGTAYTGPRASGSDESTRFTLEDLNETSDYVVGMTDYGVLISRLDSPVWPDAVTFTMPAAEYNATIRFTINPSCVVQICGNGRVEGTESCDSGASNGACPSSCSATCGVNICRSGGGGSGLGGNFQISHEKVEGKIEASDARLWVYVRAGQTISYSTNQKIAISKITLHYAEGEELVRLHIRQFAEQPPKVPNATGVYKYLYVEHQGLEGVDQRYVEFKVPKQWLQEQSVGVENIVLMRLENGVWTTYRGPTTGETETEYLFNVSLPGFSYLAIGAQQATTKPVITGTPVPEQTSISSQPEQPFTPAQPPASVLQPEQERPAADFIVEREEAAGLSMWIIIGIIVGIIAVGVVGVQVYSQYRKGGQPVKQAVPVQNVQKTVAPAQQDPVDGITHYAATLRARGVPDAEIKQRLLAVGWDEAMIDRGLHPAEQPKEYAPEHDPADAVHRYILTMRARGISDQEIRARLVGSGWDALVIDMELMRK